MSFFAIMKDHFLSLHELLSLNTNGTYNSNLDNALKVLR